MRKILLVAATVAGVSAFADPSWAGCNEVCRGKCDQTYHRGGFPSPQACYDAWSKINAQYGKRSVRFEGRVGLDRKTGKVKIYD